MAISKITTDYSDRKKDLHIFQGVNPKGTAAITPSFGKISNYCTGIQKLIQRYAICLLTSLGSQPNYPEFGTRLVNQTFNSSLLVNQVDFVLIFGIANTAVIKMFKEFQRNNAAPPDEQLASARLKGISVQNGGLVLEITIYPMQSTPVNFILPLPKN